MLDELRNCQLIKKESGPRSWLNCLVCTLMSNTVLALHHSALTPLANLHRSKFPFYALRLAAFSLR